MAKRKCANCGCELDSESRFCPNCGKTVEKVADTAPGQFDPAQKRKQSAKELKPNKPVKNTRKQNWVAIIVAAIAACLILGFVIFSLNKAGSHTVNLDKCIEEPEFSGLNGEGKMDDDPRWNVIALQHELENALGGKYKKEGKKAEDIIKKKFTLTADKTQDLSNGEIVKIQIGYHDKDIIEEKYGIHFTGSVNDYTIKTLTIPREADPFEGLQPTFSGIAPVAKVSIDVDALDKSDIEQEVLSWARDDGGSSYSISKNDEDVENQYVDIGDEIVVSLNETGQQRWRKRGYIPTRESVTYIVTLRDVPSYVQSYENLTDENKQAITDKITDMMTAYIANKYNNNPFEYLGKLFITPKDEIWGKNGCIPQLIYFYKTILPRTKDKPERTKYFAVETSDFKYLKRKSKKDDSESGAESAPESSMDVDEDVSDSVEITEDDVQEINYDKIEKPVEFDIFDSMYQEYLVKNADLYRVDYMDDTLTGFLQRIEESEPIIADPFDGLEPLFEGTAPFGSVTINSAVLENSNMDEDILSWFVYDNGDSYVIKRDGKDIKGKKCLHLGDELVISLSDKGKQKWKNRGFEPSRTEVGYTVTAADLPSYVYNYKDLSDEVLRTIRKETEDSLIDHCSEHYKNYTYDCIGVTFLQPKIELWTNKDIAPVLYTFYKVVVNDKQDQPPVTYYYYFTNIGIQYNKTNSPDDTEGSNGQTVSINNMKLSDKSKSFITYYEKCVNKNLKIFDIDYQDEKVAEIYESEKNAMSENK